MIELANRARGCCSSKLTGMVLLLALSSAIADDKSAVKGGNSAQRIEVVAGPMVCWDVAQDKLVIWFARRGNGATFLEFTKGYIVDKSTDPSRPTWIAVYGSKVDGIYPTRQVVGVPSMVRDSDLGVAVVRDLKWRSSGKPDDLIGEATLRRIPPKGESGRYTFAFGSCSHQERFGEHQPIWSAIVKDAPDCFFFIGDNIYLPSDPAAYPDDREAVRKLYRDAYDRQRCMPELQPLLRSTYCFGIWDDHDFGPNNSDTTWKWKDVAMDVFEAYFPGTYGAPDARGCFQKFSWGDVDVFLLDDRTFRDPNKAPGDGKTMFGAAQLAWLKDGLRGSGAKVKLVVNGNQMLSDRHPHEGWGTYFRPERDAFLRWLWDEKIAGVFFLSGDRHFAELIHKRDPNGVGHDVWELTSSPLANSHFARGGMVRNKERVAKYTDGVNYGVVRVDSTGTRPTVSLVVKDVSGHVVIEQRVETGL